MNLRTKPDADETMERWEEWWTCRNKRPLLTLPPIRTSDCEAPHKDHRSLEEAWLDFDFRIACAESYVCSHTFFAETMPNFQPNLGPDILSTVWGTQLQYAEDTTWTTPIASTCREVLALRPDFECASWHAVETLTTLGIERGEGLWITAVTDIHPNADILSSLVGPENLCMEMLDDPEGVRLAVEHVTPSVVEGYRRLQSVVHAAGLPTMWWLPCPHRGRMYIPNCDFSAMISTNLFVDVVLPSIREELRHTDRAIYHLDGPDALRHLDALLELDSIHGIQWVYGAGNGPARRWLDVYRKIQGSGRCMQVTCETAEEAAWFARQLEPGGVWLDVAEPLPLVEAQSLLEEISG